MLLVTAQKKEHEMITEERVKQLEADNEKLREENERLRLQLIAIFTLFEDIPEEQFYLSGNRINEARKMKLQTASAEDEKGHPAGSVFMWVMEQ